MRNVVIIILFFISVSCFAIDKKLIDGAAKYDAAVADLKKIIDAESEADLPIGEWTKEFQKANDERLSDDDRKLAQNKIDKSHKKFNELSKQQIAYEEAVKKLEPIKAEYDKQKSKEEKIKRTMFNTIVTLAMLSPFALFIWFAISRHKKYQRLLAEGKITQEEYDRMMQRSRSSTFSSSMGTNPATGLPMVGIGISDAGGNVRGSSPSYSSCSSSNSSGSSSLSNYKTYQDSYH